MAATASITIGVETNADRENDVSAINLAPMSIEFTIYLHVQGGWTA